MELRNRRTGWPPRRRLVVNRRALTGSYTDNAIPSRHHPRYIALGRVGRMPVEKLLSSVNPLSDINALFDELATGIAIRQVVIPSFRPGTLRSPKALQTHDGG